MEKINEEIDELSKIKISIYEIKKCYQEIPNNLEIKKDVRDMIAILDKIYIELFNHSEKLQLFRMYGDFYLPTISKIINRYNNFKKKSIETEEIQKLYENIEKSIKKLNIHFQSKYNSFFENEMIDLDADIKVLIQELNNKQ